VFWLDHLTNRFLIGIGTNDILQHHLMHGYIAVGHAIVGWILFVSVVDTHAGLDIVGYVSSDRVCIVSKDGRLVSAYYRTGSPNSGHEQTELNLRSNGPTMPRAGTLKVMLSWMSSSQNTAISSPIIWQRSWRLLAGSMRPDHIKIDVPTPVEWQ
jgi:hypothetical protein